MLDQNTSELDRTRLLALTMKIGDAADALLSATRDQPYSQSDVDAAALALSRLELERFRLLERSGQPPAS